MIQFVDSNATIRYAVINPFGGPVLGSKGIHIVPAIVPTMDFDANRRVVGRLSYSNKPDCLYIGEVCNMGNYTFASKEEIVSALLACKPCENAILLVSDPFSMDDNHLDTYPRIYWIPVDKYGKVEIRYMHGIVSSPMPDNGNTFCNLSNGTIKFTGTYYWSPFDAVDAALKHLDLIIRNIRSIRHGREVAEEQACRAGSAQISKLNAFINSQQAKHDAELEKKRKEAETVAKLDEKWNSLSASEKAKAIKDAEKAKKAKKAKKK
jgi:hypothetical protein